MAAVILNGQGLIFVGHSEAGKSTTAAMLKNVGVGAGLVPALEGDHKGSPLQVEILCDDRNIVRRWEEGWRVHGTWSHGDVPEVSSPARHCERFCSCIKPRAMKSSP